MLFCFVTKCYKISWLSIVHSKKTNEIERCISIWKNMHVQK